MKCSYELLVRALRHASSGWNVAVIAEGLPQISLQCKNGSAIFTRGFQKSGLLSIRVDTVLLMTPAPDYVHELAVKMLRLSKNPQTFFFFDDED